MIFTSVYLRLIFKIQEYIGWEKPRYQLCVKTQLGANYQKSSISSIFTNPINSQMQIGSKKVVTEISDRKH